ncbi:GTP cyclohydrolase I FolE [Sneathiella sp. DP05]|uniref:GTP cyclohydrolase 1 n=2 Tax=Sneathiella litorea TaxID=2606216 RepID=A0A6L8WAE5_9PROT|nr:GTP cyclohydrolase I FolE [Sneathiella litorea]
MSSVNLSQPTSRNIRSSILSPGKVSREEAEEAVRTMILWLGDDPLREGLLDTPARVVRAFEEWFSGYRLKPEEILSMTFEEVEGYAEPVTLRGIQFESYCEHHMAPIIGVVHISYIPDRKVVGLSKLARIVDLYAKRLQVQEKLTAQIANTVQAVLNPKGVAVMISAEHQCMSTRGVLKHGVDTITTQYTGEFSLDKSRQSQFVKLVTSGISR